MGKVNRKALIISLALTVVCALVLFSYVRNLKTPVEEKPKTNILVSSRDIRPGEVILAADLKEMEVSSDSVPEGILTDKAVIEGMFAKEAILAGEPFREQRLAKREALPLSQNLPKGFRAVSIFINESNLLSMQIMTGDYVDVIASWTVTPKKGNAIQLTKIVMQHVQVLALGPNRVLGENAGIPNRGGYNIEDIPKTVTLAVTPEDAERIIFNTNNSAFTLALRGKTDEEIVDTDGTIVTDMIPARLLPFAAMPGDMTSDGSGSGTEPTDASAGTSSGNNNVSGTSDSTVESGGTTGLTPP